MDCKQIEELLERYRACETSLQEEAELSAFFASENVPPHLQAERDFFLYYASQRELSVSDDFEQKILNRLQAVPVVKARRISFAERLAPLFKAVAVVVFLCGVGTVLKYSFYENELVNPDADSCVTDTLQMLSESINDSSASVESVDSLLPKESIKPVQQRQ